MKTTTMKVLIACAVLVGAAVPLAAAQTQIELKALVAVVAEAASAAKDACGNSSSSPCVYADCSEGLADAGAAGENPSTSASVPNQKSGYHTSTHSWASGTGWGSASASVTGASASC